MAVAPSGQTIAAGNYAGQVHLFAGDLSSKLETLDTKGTFITSLDFVSVGCGVTE